MSVCGYVYTCMCAAKIKYFKGKHISFNNVICRYILTLPDSFFPFVFVVAEKGTGDIASIDWCSDTLAL